MLTREQALVKARWFSLDPKVTAELLVRFAEECGVEWAPEPTPEPTIADGEIVRVVDGKNRTWAKGRTGGWWCIDDKFFDGWLDIPQPVTVLRSEAGR